MVVFSGISYSQFVSVYWFRSYDGCRPKDKQTEILLESCFPYER
jgi:hypothetical protein